MQKIGKSVEEIDAEKLLECRKIVKNIVNFGVSESQKLQLIYLLAMEMESRQALEAICQAVKKVRENENDVNFSLTENSLEYNNEEKVEKPKIIEL